MTESSFDAERREELAQSLLGSSRPAGAPGLSGSNVQMSSVRRRRLMFDAVFGALFGAFALAIFLLALTVGAKGIANRRTPSVIIINNSTSNSTDPSASQQPTYEGAKVFTGLITTCGTGLGLAAIWLQVIVWCAPTLLSFTLVAVGVLGLGTMSAFFAGNNPWAGVVTLIVTLSAIVHFQQLKKRIVFAAANLKIACAAIWDSPPLILVSLILLFAQVLWGLLWALAVYGAATNANLTTLIGPSGRVYSMTSCATYQTAGPNPTFADTCIKPGTCLKCVCAGETISQEQPCFRYRLYAGWLVVLLFGYLWGCAVIRNIAHCTVSSTVGTWWVCGAQRSSQAVYGHFKRAATSSFGSICLGSMLVAFVQVTRQLFLNMHRANQRTTQSNAITALLGCLLSLVERAITWFNRYALVYVALYGIDFMSAGAATTELFKSRGISSLVNDTLVEGILNLGAFIVGLLCSVVAYLYARSLHLSRPSMAVLSVAGAFIGAALAWVVAAVAESGVTTTFVCFAEDPESLEISHPELADALTAAWEGKEYRERSAALFRYIHTDVLQGPLTGMRGRSRTSSGSIYAPSTSKAAAKGSVSPSMPRERREREGEGDGDNIGVRQEGGEENGGKAKEPLLQLQEGQEEEGRQESGSTEEV